MRRRGAVRLLSVEANVLEKNIRPQRHPPPISASFTKKIHEARIIRAAERRSRYRAPQVLRRDAAISPSACHELALRLGDFRLDRIASESGRMYQAPKHYVATSVGALALAILSLLVAIAATSFATPDIAADAVDIKLDLRKSLPR